MLMTVWTKNHSGWRIGYFVDGDFLPIQDMDIEVIFGYLEVFISVLFRPNYLTLVGHFPSLA